MQRQRLVYFVLFLCCFNVSAINYCNKTGILVSAIGFRCSVEEKDCAEFTYKDYDLYPPENITDKINLRAYAENISYDHRRTAFNISITDTNISELLIRYQSLRDESDSNCTLVRLYGNESNTEQEEVHVSYKFPNNSHESYPYGLDYLMTGDKKYGKRYIFKVPVSAFIAEDTRVKQYNPFVYIDMSYAPLKLSLHIQHMEKMFNITGYKIWLINNDTDQVESFTIKPGENFPYDFSKHTGVFYFNVAAMDPVCGAYGCTNSTTPYITRRGNRLLIMIISTVWIPPVILYVLYYLYKLCREGIKKEKRKSEPKCLLVYSPTHQLHTNVMIELMNYLKKCNINAMTIIPDVIDITSNDQEYWCDAAFQKADVILIATSPPLKEPTISTICQNTDTYLLKLIRESRSQRTKRYYIVQLPYCNSNDVPGETSHLTRFCLPRELTKLVKIILGIEPERYVSTASDREFLNSVNLAKTEIERPMKQDGQETEILLSEENTRVPTDDANIQYLNLLGESEENDQTHTERSSRNEICALPIERLDL